MEDEQLENQDSLTPEEEGETSKNNEPDLESRMSALEQELAKQREIAENQRIRAEKAEAKAKATPQPKETKEEVKTASPDVEEIVLKAQGMPEDLIKDLKAVAQVRGKSLIEAQNDPLFAGIKATYEKEQKASEASLGASKGSTEARAKKDFNTPGLSRDEHKDLYKQKIQ